MNERGFAIELEASRAEILRLRDELTQATLQLNSSRDEIAVLLNESEKAVRELYLAYRKPFRPLKSAAVRGLLKSGLLFRQILPSKVAARYERSLKKRKPSKILRDWKGLEERLKAVALWTPATPQNEESAVGKLFQTAGIDVSTRILVADYRLPRPDVSAGERATVGILEDLRAMGFHVVFLPKDMKNVSPYASMLEGRGIEVVSTESGYQSPEAFVRARGHEFGTFYLIREDVAAPILPAIRLFAPNGRIVFHAPDLYFLREGRAAELSGDPADKERAEATKERELAVMRASDHVVLVSSAELPVLRQFLPSAPISVFPALYSTVVGTPAAYENRENIVFVGGFGHTPNIDAVCWFADEVWPSIHAAMPDVEFHIVGAEAPQVVSDLAKRPGIQFVGYVKDLDATLAFYRVSVAPLRFGAGIKGKVAAALGAGVPTVLTGIAAEGMGIVDRIHALVRDEAEAFARATVELYRDKALWSELAQNGRHLVDRRFGAAANRGAYLRVLEAAQALPLNLMVEYCRRTSRVAFPQYAFGEQIDVSIIVPVYNQWHFTRDCLVSIATACMGSTIRYEVILADDCSTDETTESAQQFVGLRVERTSENIGFLRNCKNAAKSARGDHLLFLNNDTIVLPGWLDALYTTMESEPNAAIVGSKLLYPDGTIQEAGGILFSDSTANNLGRGKGRFDAQFNFRREVGYITGASMLVRGSFWHRLGGFDERYRKAYCEDSDLAMAARDQGLCVLYEPASEVVHFEHGSFGEQLTDIPRALMAENGRVLLDKWREQFRTLHLRPEVDPAIAAANAERHVPHKALDRRKSGHLNILYFSPFPSHPQNHGNQATIYAYGQRFKSLGHKVHFVVLQGQSLNEASTALMKQTWDSLDVLPASHPLVSNGSPIMFDGWYEEGLGEAVRVLCAKYDIDVVFCSYIFQSKLLNYVPAHVLKVIDTHDKMGDRYEMLRKNGQPLEFFSCSPEEEGAYLRRADVVVARRREEADYFDFVSGKNHAVVIPHVEEPNFLERTYPVMKTVGVVASANQINLAIVLELLQKIDRRFGSRVPFQVRIAGEVKDMVAGLCDDEAAMFDRPWVEMLGFVDDITDFYRSVDVVVSPVTMGTGINVKTVQAMAFGMPLLTTAWGIKGIETDDPMHNHADLAELCQSLAALSDNPAPLAELADLSRTRYRLFYRESVDAIDGLFNRVKT